MSFSFRDKGRLSDRLRGKSGDELLNEFKQQIDQDRKMFFEPTATWGTSPSSSFTRGGFPFDDEMMPRGRQDIRSHLDDLAQRHPEFADHLRCPPWGGEIHSGWSGRPRTASGSMADEDTRSQASGGSDAPRPNYCEEQEQVDEPGPLRGRQRSNLSQHGLRNTVDMGQQQHSAGDKEVRGQRSWSAPPDGRTAKPDQPQRYISRLEINPVNPDEQLPTSPSDAQGKPPVAPKQAQAQSKPQNQPKQEGNVRHIPIFVEGRDEPVLPRNVNASDTFTSPRTPHRPFSGRSSPFGVSSQTKPQPQFVPPTPHAPQKSKPFHQNESQPLKQQKVHTSQEEQVMKEPPKPPEAPAPNDPISKVKVVQKDVDDLKAQVEQFTGTSRRDRQYVYLDEMLTRNLLKLDDIDTEGKANVRQARKDVICSIQKCISLLESKVPLEQAVSEAAEEMRETEEPMDVCAEVELQESGLDGTRPISEMETCSEDCSKKNELGLQVEGQVKDVDASVQGEVDNSIKEQENKTSEVPVADTQTVGMKTADSEAAGTEKDGLSKNNTLVAADTCSQVEPEKKMEVDADSLPAISESVGKSESAITDLLSEEHQAEDSAASEEKGGYRKCEELKKDSTADVSEDSIHQDNEVDTSKDQTNKSVNGTGTSESKPVDSSSPVSQAS